MTRTIRHGRSRSTALSSSKSIVARFAKVAAQYASQTAICGNGEKWTYEELERRTNQVARAILDRTLPGIGCIAYLVSHSPNMVICALGGAQGGKGILMSLSCDRRSRLCETSFVMRRRIYCSPMRLTKRLPEALPGMTYPSFGSKRLTRAIPETPLRLTITPSDPAAIFYTSGSTGRPKGVVKSHRAVLHRAWLCAQYNSINTTDRQSLLTYCSFCVIGSRHLRSASERCRVGIVRRCIARIHGIAYLDR